MATDSTLLPATTDPASEAAEPILVLRNVVLFPKIGMEIRLERPDCIGAVEEALSRDLKIVVVAQRDTRVENPTPADLFSIGSLAEIVAVQPHAAGGAQILLRGLSRARITQIETSGLFYSGRIERLSEHSADPRELARFVLYVRELIERHQTAFRRFDEKALQMMRESTDAGLLADLAGMQIVSELAERQDLLEELDPCTRLELLAARLAADIERVEIEQRVKERVRAQMDKNQREYYLREQLKAIHDEMSGGEGSEFDALREQIRERGLPADVEAKLLKEVSRLERMSAMSAEASVVRTYIDTVLSLPWNTQSEDNLDIAHAAQVLNSEHFGLDSVKQRILEFLAVRKLTQQRSRASASILCLSGPPGVGKTSLVQSIARAMGREFVRVSLGGVRDEAEIRGHRRTYVGALPGRIMAAMKSAGTMNPVILLDEIDKMTSDQRGDPAAAMLEVLDPGQNSTFTDHFMELPFDLSKVMFVATANYLAQIPRPLRDRMEIIEISGYSEQEKIEIGRRHLLPKQLDAHGLEPGLIAISDKSWSALIHGYTREAGVRNLERQVAAICRKVASEVATGRRAQRMRLTEGKMAAYLGPGRFGHDLRDTENQVGVTMGLGTTDTGGELIPVEVAVMPGSGALLVTGQAGEVMRESARAGFTYIRASAEKLGISADFPGRCDVHIHLPEAAIPKDGPSAGITMVTALVSALTGTPVRADVAMTGEVTLRGRVLPIGGLRDKTLAAHRAGIRRVIAPMANRSDLARIPKRVAAEMEFIWVEHMDEVLAAALDHSTSPLELSSIEPSVLEHFSGYVFTVKHASPAKNRLAG